MTNINQDYIVDYIKEVLPNRRKYFYDMENYAKEYNIPIIEPEVAQFIKTLLKIHNPKNILEIGTAIGYSALIMADALDGNCSITSIERSEDILEIAKRNVSKTPYKDNIKLLLGDAKDIIPNLKEKYDFIFIDAAKGQYLDFFNMSINNLNPKGVVLSDNILFKGMVATDNLVIPRQKTIVKRLRDYINYINKIDNYTTSIIPIGDGIALTYREA